MKKCTIIPAFIEGPLNDLFRDRQDQFIICADGGFENAVKADIVPDLIIGDFDSYKGVLPEDIPVMKLPVEKDDTDTGFCVDLAIKKGFDDITIIGGIGGRFDHTMANIQTLAGATERGVRIRIISENNEITAVKNDTIHISNRPGWKLAVFSLTEKSKGVDLENVYYSLKDAELSNLFPLGVSNEFGRSGDAVITVKDGMLLVVISNES